jgi:hypothetical protein
MAVAFNVCMRWLPLPRKSGDRIGEACAGPPQRFTYAEPGLPLDYLKLNGAGRLAMRQQFIRAFASMRARRTASRQDQSPRWTARCRTPSLTPRESRKVAPF